MAVRAPQGGELEVPLQGQANSRPDAASVVLAPSPTAPSTHGPAAYPLTPDPEPLTDGDHSFPAVIPDYMIWDAGLARPKPRPCTRDSRGRAKRQPVFSAAWFDDIVRYGLVMQRCLPVVIPDVLLGSLVWGPRSKVEDWPPNWRRTLQSGCRLVIAAGPTGGCTSRQCPAGYCSWCWPG
jgi:hypothetical protein